MKLENFQTTLFMQFHKKGIFLIIVLFITLSSCQQEEDMNYDPDDSMLSISDIKKSNGTMYYLIKKWDTVLVCKLTNDKFETLHSYIFYNKSDKIGGKYHNIYDLTFGTPYISLQNIDNKLVYFGQNDQIIDINSMNSFKQLNELFNIETKRINNREVYPKYSLSIPRFPIYNMIFVDNSLYYVYNYDLYLNYVNSNIGGGDYSSYLNYYKNRNQYKQELIKLNLNTLQAEKIVCSDFNNEILLNMFVLNNIKFVCSKNKIFQLDNCKKTIISEIAIDDELKYYHQNGNNEIVFITIKNNIVVFDGNSYQFYSFDNLIHSKYQIDGNLIPLEIYKKNNTIYSISFEIESSNLYFFKFDISSNVLTKLFNSDEEFKRKNEFYLSLTNKMLQSKYGASMNPMNMLVYGEPYKYDFAIETDNDDNVYFGCNGMFVFDKNDQLKQFYNARDISQMIYKGR